MMFFVPLFLVCSLFGTGAGEVALTVKHSKAHSYELIIRNNKSEPISAWKLGNIWGDRQFHGVFRKKNSAEIFLCERRLGYYNVHAPVKLIIGKGESKSFEIDLDDGTWAFERGARPNELELVTWIYSPEISDESIEQRIYLTRLFSDGENLRQIGIQSPPEDDDGDKK